MYATLVRVQNYFTGHDPLDDIVTVTCYGKTEQMTRRKALAEFLDGMRCCEGSEAERYSTIYFQLLDGAMEASDQEY